LIKKNSLKQFRKNTEGISVIIGALMLTVIVVSAAASFAIFSAQKQEELQKQEFSKLLRDSEQIQINRIEVEYSTTSYNLSNCTFFLTSQHQRDTKINGVTLNEMVLKRFHIDRQGTERETWNFSRGAYRKEHSDPELHEPLQISPMERIQITIENIDESFDDWFFKLKDIDNISSNTPIQFSVQTSLTNVFEKTFLPPIPNIEIRQEENSIILDGSRSFCEDEATIIEWKWNLTNQNPTPNVYLPIMYGKQINAHRILTDQDGVTDFQNYNVKWNITLTVENNYGMLGIINVTHIQDFRDQMAKTESIRITDIDPEYNDDFTLKTLNITFQSQHNYNSNISQIKINDNDIILTSDYLNLTSYTSNHTDDINVASHILSMNQPITVKYKTMLGNTFTETFYPPTANMIIDLKGDTDIPYLDGSNSDNPGDAYIVSWEWNITSYPYLFKDLNNDFYFNQTDIFLGYFDYDGDHYLSKTRVQKDYLQGGKFAFEGNDTANEPFIFWDKNNNSIFDADEKILNYDPDGNEISATPKKDGTEWGYLWAYNTSGVPFLFYDKTNTSFYDESEDIYKPYLDFGNDESANGNPGGVLLFTHWNKEFYGRILSNPLYYEGCLHEITLTVTNNYGLKGKHTMFYKY
jgi:hypothetical protein